MNKIILSLTCFVFLVGLSGSGSAATITSCGTVTEDSVLGADLTSSGTCLTIGASNIVLDCAGYSIGGGGGSGIYGSGKSNVTIKNCNVTKFLRGIYLYSSSNNTLTNNTVTWNDYGIILESSSNNTLTSNIASNNVEEGISLVFSNNNNLSDSVASNNMKGIWISSSSSNTIINNKVNSNVDFGIWLTWSGNNTISNNNVNLSHSYGIYLQDSGDNNIFNNYFKNTNNFYFDGTIYSNDWNTTKTLSTNIVGGPYLGGNFWAKPDGTGFSETCSDADSDGICDTPYTLDSGNVDYLPLAVYTINATIDIDPDTLNLKTKGGWITAYIKLPSGHDVNNIDVSTVKLNDAVLAKSKPVKVGDYDGDGIADLMVKFDKAEVTTLLTLGDNEITISGELNNGTPFEGSDTIRAI